MLILENILSAVVSSTTKWLPGQNFIIISEGGSPHISYHWALTMSVMYLAGAFAVVAFLFKRRDVAN